MVGAGEPPFRAFPPGIPGFVPGLVEGGADAEGESVGSLRGLVLCAVEFVLVAALGDRGHAVAVGVEVVVVEFLVAGEVGDAAFPFDAFLAHAVDVREPFEGHDVSLAVVGELSAHFLHVRDHDGEAQGDLAGLGLDFGRGLAGVNIFGTATAEDAVVELFGKRGELFVLVDEDAKSFHVVSPCWCSLYVTARKMKKIFPVIPAPGSKK